MLKSVLNVHFKMYSKTTTVALSLTTLTFIFCYLGTVGIGIVSARPDPIPQHQTPAPNNDVDYLALFAQLGGDPAQEYRRILEFLIPYAEHLAQDGSKRCNANNVKIDYEDLKDDMVTCLESTITKVVTKYTETGITVDDRIGSPYQLKVEGIKNTLQEGLALCKSQKKFITDHILRTICGALLPLLTVECNQTEYKHLAKFQQKCRSEVEKGVEVLGSAFIRDVCRNDAAWVFDLLDTHPYKCREAIAKYTKGPDFCVCRDELESIIPQQNSSKEFRIELGTKQQFCNMTSVYRGCMSNLLIDSCPENPKFGQVLLDTFKETRGEMSAICGATGILSNLGFVMIAVAVMITKFMQNFFV